MQDALIKALCACKRRPIAVTQVVETCFRLDAGRRCGLGEVVGAPEGVFVGWGDGCGLGPGEGCAEGLAIGPHPRMCPLVVDPRKQRQFCCAAAGAAAAADESVGVAGRPHRRRGRARSGV